MKKVSPFLFYLFYFAGLSAFMPYIVLYYTAIGLSGGQIGVLSSMGPLISMAAGPLWAGIADATSRHRLILTLNALATAGIILLFPAAGGFTGLLLLGALFAAIISPINALADSTVMLMLRGDGGRYGRHRMGGSFGWGLAAPLVGLLIERSGQQWIFWGYAGLMVVAVLVAQALGYPASYDKGAAEIRQKDDPDNIRRVPATQSTFWRSLRTLLADRRWLTLLSLLFICGVGLGSINTYLPLHMQNLGAGQSLIGVALTLSVIAEAPVLFFSSRLTGRFSPRSLLLGGMAAVSLRLLLTAVSRYVPAERIFPGIALQWNILVIFAAQLLHGMTFPVLWVAGVAYAHKNAPPGLAATAQGVMGSIFMGLGSAAGAFIGGLLIEATGTGGMYLFYSALLLAALVFFAAITRSKIIEL